VTHEQAKILIGERFGGAQIEPASAEATAGKGVTHSNTVARKLSRLSARIKALSVG